MYEVVENKDKIVVVGGKILEIVEDEDRYFVIVQKENYTTVRLYLKGRSLEKIKEILYNRFFPANLVRQLDVVKQTQAIEIAENAAEKDTGLYLEGPAGVGKTFACIFAIARLMKFFKVNNPLYVSCITYRKAIWDLYPDADAFLIDDLNANIDSIEIKLVEKIVYNAWNEKKYLFITSNSPFRKIQSLLSEPILSRVLSLTRYAKIDGADYRLEKL